MSFLKTLIAFSFFLMFGCNSIAQVSADLSKFDESGEAAATVENKILKVSWPSGENETGTLEINLASGEPLFSSIQLTQNGNTSEIATNLDPVFILTEGTRDLNERGWNRFFDRTAYRPHTPYLIELDKKDVEVFTEGSRTRIIISGVEAGDFSGNLEITAFNGSPLLKIEAVVSTSKDGVAIIYDAGLVSKDDLWQEIFWADTEGFVMSAKTEETQESENVAVKYRTIIGESEGGNLAVFPPPHQYFYPLDNAYNLKFTWHGSNYREMISGYGIGIRHDLMGDRRHVPWFNAPPNTMQRLSFFTLLSSQKDAQVLEEVKELTNGDSFKTLPGYKTMASHFHTEHIDDIMTHKPLPDFPGHVKAMRELGVNIMHQGEFHLAGNPKDPGPRRLEQLKMMFDVFEELSDGNFIMLPGEEPNVHLGGHWMNIFPEPVYWFMNRRVDQPFVEEDPDFGKVYRVGNKEEMLRLLEEENGLAWTAHARTKGSTGYPDEHKDEEFFHSDRFLGAAWKAMPADLSLDRLGKRALDLMDDLANWGHRKYMIGEADIFKLEPSYEIYGHLNINYLQMDKLPKYEEGWASVLEAMEQGKFFVSTGEVLLPEFNVNGKSSGEEAALNENGEAEINLTIHWTFPLSFAEVISGDGKQLYRERISLDETRAFGEEDFNFKINLKDRKWVRVEVWDAAVNGAFTQFVWLE